MLVYASKFVCGATYALAVDASLAVNASSYPSMCTDKWLPTVSTVCPLGLPHKKLQEWGHSYVQNEAQKAHSQIISWLLVALLNATCIAFCLKKMNNSDFRFFQVEQVLDIIVVIVYWGSLYNKCLWTLALAVWWNYCCANANTLIGAAILFPGHPYIWATLPWVVLLNYMYTHICT